MSSLAEHLDAAGRELRLAAILRGLAWMLAALAAGLLVAGTLDYLTRSNGDFWRGLLSLLAFLPALLIGGVFVVWPLLARPSRLDLARRIERADSSWDGALISGTAFLVPRQDFGSTALQKETQEVVTARIDSGSKRPPVNWNQVIRAAWIAGSAFLLGLFVVALAPTPSTTALARLARPFAPIEWPRRVELRLLDESGEPLTNPVSISQGQSFRFFVANVRGKLPADMMLEVRGPDGRLHRRPVPTTEAPPPGFELPGASKALGVASMFASDGLLRFRVTGGDDHQMPFRTANVVVPPRLDNFVVTVTPPAYLRAEATTTPAGVARVRSVAGATVTIHARANKALESVALFVGDEPGPDPVIRDQGRQVVASFVLGNERSSSYWFRLRDRTGLENPRAPRYEISTKIDAPPEVTLPKPAEDATATREAILAISVNAADDFDLTSVRLRYGRGSRLPDARSAELKLASQTIPLLTDQRRPREFQRGIEWPLARLNLAVGDQLTIRAEATDAYDLGTPHLAVSAPTTVTIVAKEIKRAELLGGQAALLSELFEAHHATLELRRTAVTLAADLSRADTMEAASRDQLARLEREGQRLNEHLVGSDDGSEATARRLLAEMNDNRIADAAMKNRLQTIVDELTALRENSLATANRQLTAAAAAAGPADAAAALQASRDDLTIVVEGLASLVDSLGAWRNRRNVLTEIRDLVHSQKELVEETTRTATETLGTKTDQLTNEQTNRLHSLANRQDSLAERFDRLNTQLQSTADPAAATDENKLPSQPLNKPKLPEYPLTSAQGDPLLGKAAERLQSSALPAAARAAGESIRANRLGEANQRQSEILAELDGLREILAQQTNSLPTTAEMTRLRQELSGLTEKQADLLETLIKRQANQSQSAEQQTFLSDQGALRARTVAAARAARNAHAAGASHSLRQAAGAMARGLERLRHHADREAQNNLTKAIKQLRKAEQQIAKEAAGKQNPLAKPIGESTAGRIQGLAKRQAALNKEIIRLDQLKNENGSLNRAQLLTLRKTEDIQSAIRKETDALCQALGDSAVVQYVLKSAVHEMRTVAEQLAERDTGPATQGTAARVLARLREITEAIKTARDGQFPQQKQAADTENPQSSGAPPSVVQLELLRFWQIDLQQRTQKIEKNSQTGELTPAQTKELADIAGELTAIRELAASLLE